MKKRILGLEFVFSLVLVMASFSFASVLYPDVYGIEGLEKIDEKTKDKVLVIYLDEAYADPNPNKDLGSKSLLSAKKRIIQLAEAFKSYENLCMLMVFTHENSVLPKTLPVDKGDSPLKGISLNINKVDSNTWKILRKYNLVDMPVAIIDYEPEYKWDPTKGFEQQFLPKDDSTMLKNIKSAIGKRVSNAIKAAENAIKNPKEGNDPEAFYREAKSLLKNVSNPHYIFTYHEFHEYCRDLVRSYINIAVKGTLQKNPAEVDINEIIAENRILMSAGGCLKMSLDYMNRHTDTEACPDIKGVTELFYSGLTAESKVEFEIAKDQYEQAQALDPGWEEIRISLVRVKEKIQRVLLCIHQEIMFYDELSEEISHFPNYYQQILAQDLNDKGYKVIIPMQKKEVYEQLEMLEPGEYKSQDSQNDVEHTSNRMIFGKAIISVRRFDVNPFENLDLKQIVVEGNVQLCFMKIGGETRTPEIIKSFYLNKLDRGIGKTAFKAAADFFDQNEDILKTELDRFLGEIGEPE